MDSLCIFAAQLRQRVHTVNTTRDKYHLLAFACTAHSVMSLNPYQKLLQQQLSVGFDGGTVPSVGLVNIVTNFLFESSIVSSVCTDCLLMYIGEFLLVSSFTPSVVDKYVSEIKMGLMT